MHTTGDFDVQQEFKNWTWARSHKGKNLSLDSKVKKKVTFEQLVLKNLSILIYEILFNI